MWGVLDLSTRTMGTSSNQLVFLRLNGLNSVNQLEYFLASALILCGCQVRGAGWQVVGGGFRCIPTL